MKAIIYISSSLSSTVEGVLKSNVAEVTKFNDVSDSWLDDVVLVRSGFYRLIYITILDE